MAAQAWGLQRPCLLATALAALFLSLDRPSSAAGQDSSVAVPSIQPSGIGIASSFSHPMAVRRSPLRAPVRESSLLADGPLAGRHPLACPPATERVPVPMDGPPLRAPGVSAGDAGAAAADAGPARAAAATPTRQIAADSDDYRNRLATTPFGWPRLDHWCVWVEPLSGSEAGRIWEERWLAAVGRALNHWGRVLPIRLVTDPAEAHVLLQRRRPPLSPGVDGRLRASHGRATLTILRVRRLGVERLEPAVEVLISPAQREPAMQATALHELGHAFGLWAHSDHPSDAMAAVPGREPVLQLSPRDRATLHWLYSQPTRLGQPLTP